MPPQKQIQFNRVVFQKLSNVRTYLADFKCSKPQFSEYLRVNALHDQQQQIGQTWIFLYEKQIVGFVTIAMAHMKKAEHVDLQIDTFGNIPALLVGHIAVHEDYERQGVGRHMISWVISKGSELSATVGCRLVMLRKGRD